MQNVIEACGLSKVYRVFSRREGVSGALADLFNRRYREVLAVDRVSFEIEGGEIVGYIGANGAGKSTTIKMMTGILRPTSGRIVVNGLVPSQQRKRHAHGIGVLFGQRTQLFWDIAVIETLRLLQKIYDVPKADFERRLSELTELLSLEPLLKRPTRKLSLGERMRCDFAASVIHDPPVLFLDEPTIGLDVAAKYKVREAIRHVALERGKTVLLTTHDLADVEDLCARIVIIDRGRILFDGSVESIKRKMGRRRKALVEFHREVSASEVGCLFDGDSVDVRQTAPNQVEVRFSTDSMAPQELISGLIADLPVGDIILKGPELSDIVRRIYEGESLEQ